MATCLTALYAGVDKQLPLHSVYTVVQAQHCLKYPERHARCDRYSLFSFCEEPRTFWRAFRTCFIRVKYISREWGRKIGECHCGAFTLVLKKRLLGQMLTYITCMTWTCIRASLGRVLIEHEKLDHSVVRMLLLGDHMSGIFKLIMRLRYLSSYKSPSSCSYSS